MIKVLIAILVLVPAASFAQTWHTTNQVTFAWDAVPKIADSDKISYQVYMKHGGTTATVQPYGSPVAETQQVITFDTEGRYYLCAQTLRLPAGETEFMRSEINCSDVAASTKDGIPFGVRYFVPPAPPGGLRPSR